MVTQAEREKVEAVELAKAQKIYDKHSGRFLNYYQELLNARAEVSTAAMEVTVAHKLVAIAEAMHRSAEKRREEVGNGPAVNARVWATSELLGEAIATKEAAHRFQQDAINTALEMGEKTTAAREASEASGELLTTIHLQHTKHTCLLYTSPSLRD